MSSFPYDPAPGNRNHISPKPGGLYQRSRQPQGPSQPLHNPAQNIWSQQPAPSSSNQQRTYINNNALMKEGGFGVPPQAAWTSPSTINSSFGYDAGLDLSADPYGMAPASENRPQMFGIQQRPMPQPVQPPPPASDDAWNWGWDESSSDSPATSTPNNNWTSQTPVDSRSTFYNPVQNYFQPNAQPPSAIQARDPIPPAGNALTVENVANVDPGTGVDSTQPESLHSYQSGSNASDVKGERLSPDPPKVPLTTQALREFHKEAFENGPSSNRHGGDGLTPQWSIESQLSQDTASDDVSASLAGGSDADMAPSAWQDEEGDKKYGNARNDSYPDPEMNHGFASLSLGEVGTENEEVIPTDRQTNLDHPAKDNGMRGLFSSSSANSSLDISSPRGDGGLAVRSQPPINEIVPSPIAPPPASRPPFEPRPIQRIPPPPANEIPVAPPPIPARSSTGKPPSALPEVAAWPTQSPRSNEIYGQRRSLTNFSYPYSPPVGGMPLRSADSPGLGGPIRVPTASPLVASSPHSFDSSPIAPVSNVPTTQSELYQTPQSDIHQPLSGAAPPQMSNPRENQLIGNMSLFRPDGAPPRGQDLGVELEVQPIPVDPLSRPDGYSAPLPPFASPPESYPQQHRPDTYAQSAFVPAPQQTRPADPYPTTNPTDDSVNLETIPDNKERPDAENRAGRHSLSQRGASWYGNGPDNQEVAPHGDRNQYLETGQLMEQDSLVLNESSLDMDGMDAFPPPGLARHVTGEGHNADISTPPPGLDRMVLGQITEGEQSTNPSAAHGTPPPAGLHRMVLGQLTDEHAAFRRMVPGESSSPETQGQTPPPSDGPREARVVPGVARDESDAPALPVPASPVVHRPSVNASPDPQNRLQPQAERSETIGSDNVEAFPVALPENTSKHSKRREKDRHRDDPSSDEREAVRRQRDTDYYRDRDRERDDSPGGERRRVDWERRRRQSPHRYYRDERRRRREYEYSDDDEADGSGYYSDRDRRNMSGYRDDYDRTFPRREDRARSLRPDKVVRDRNEERKDVKDRRRGGYDRDRDRDARQSDYYRRRGHEEGEDFRDQRSRPSSRNDSSVHDMKHRGLSGRTEFDRDSERGHNRSQSKRDMYYAQVPGGFNFDPAAYYQYCQYQYYENLRRTNPAAYAEYYRKYYASSQHGTYSEDRGSVHSGRSSANDDSKDRSFELKKNVYTTPPFQMLHPFYHPYAPHVHPASSPPGAELPGRIDSSMVSEPDRPQRMTPTKFTTAHVKGTLSSRGQLIKVLAHYPLDGQLPTIEVYESLFCYEDARKELQDFPGPLVKGVTHKNNVVRYCKQKIREADTNPDLFDKESYKLIWELLILLLRQNGTVVGTDIAELLMAHTSAQPPAPSPASSHHSINEIPGHQNLQEEEVTNKFRDLLIYGNTKEALEWAMKHGLWGHALFLASKMDQRTYASVMTRFANGLPLNDPLQTLYQLMSGKQPAAVTCCSDEKWGDWRPHLAMMLSNPSGRPELDHRAITALGDTLQARGAIYAAHFCYLMAQVEFGNYSSKSSKIVLISSPHNLPFSLFATNEAIFATETFEFACNLADTEFALPHLQIYKLLVARRLAEVGLTQEAVHYVEVIAVIIAKQPSLYSSHFIQEVYDLGSMLKFSDPVYTSSDNNGQDPEWLQQLMPIIEDYQSGILQQQTYGGSISNITNCSDNDRPNFAPDPEVSWQQPEPPQLQQPPQVWNQEVQQPSPDTFPDHRGDFTSYGGSSSDTPSYWTPPPANQWPQSLQEDVTSPMTPLGVPQPSSQSFYDPNRSEAPPSITLPGANSSRVRTTSQSSDGVLSGTQREPQQQQHQPSKQSMSEQNNGALRSGNQQGGGWFGGLWTKFSLKPKNQMILPDDKNPSILWDPDKKRWIDQNSSGDDVGGALPPPPVATPPAPASNNPLDPSKPPSLGGNVYKMSRGKSLRANYVDVMNPGGKAPAPTAVPAPDLFPSLSYSTQPAKLFMPPPVENQDGPVVSPFTSANPADSSDFKETQPQGLSRWSSTSSLSKEVQRYTSRGMGRLLKMSGEFTTPMNSSGPWNNGAVGGTLPRSKRSYL